MTNRLPWSQGYLQTLGNRPLAGKDVLPQHYFRSWAGRYYDKHANELPGPIEPSGTCGLASFRTIDDVISDAIGDSPAADDR